VKEELEYVASEVQDVQERLKNVKEDLKMVAVDVEKRIEDRQKTLAQELMQTGTVGLLSGLAPSVKAVRVKSPKYDGQTTWSTHFKQFEAAANANGWTEEDTATGLILALRGDALRTFSKQCLTTNSGTTSVWWGGWK
jgi:hypothetical protein